MDYKQICAVYSELEATSKGLEKTQILAKFLGELKRENSFEYIYLLQGKIFSDYDARELGMSIQLVIKAISKASGYKDFEVIKEFKKIGDLGKVAEELLGGKKQQSSLFPKKLDVKDVFNNLRKISELEGTGTVESKINFIVELLHSATAVEAKYIIRTVLNDLKIGIGAGIIRDAIVEFCFNPKNINEKKKYAEIVQEAYDKCTDFALVLEKAIENKLNDIKLFVGKPVKVMLYPKAKDVEEAFKIVGKPAAFEYKYDGFRMMINKIDDGKIKIFTRRLEEVSKQFPDVIKFVQENVHGKNFIIDAEAVGYDASTKQYRDFQYISQRIKRKYDIDKLIRELPIELRIFDIIFYDGKSLIDKNYSFRRKLIEKIVDEIPWRICLAEQIVTDENKVAEKFFEKAIEDGQEGLMVKGLDKPYKPGARIGYGVKWKPDDKDFDLIITGAEWGNGKRAGWLTSFDVSCNDNGVLKEIGKVSTGLKEKKELGFSFEELTHMLKKLEIEENGKHIKVNPKIVVAVKYQNIQKSPSYSSGYALRFPRIIRLRPDRGKDDIATLDEIKKEVEK